MTTAKKTTKKTAKKTTKKTAKKTAKKTTKKTGSKASSKKSPSKKEESKDVSKVDVKKEVKSILEGVSLSVSQYEESVDLLVSKLRDCNNFINDDGAVMAITNELVDLLPVGEPSGLDIIFDAMNRFKINYAVVKNQVGELETEVKKTPEYVTLEHKRKQLQTAGNFGKVFSNYLDMTSKHFYDQYVNDIETPLGRKFQHTSRASLSISDIEKVPSEFKQGQIVIKDASKLEEVKALLDEAGIEYESEFKQTSGQKKSLKEMLEEKVKAHRDFMSATEEERKEEGLKDVDVESVFEENGAVAKYDARPLGEFKKIIF